MIKLLDRSDERQVVAGRVVHDEVVEPEPGARRELGEEHTLRTGPGAVGVVEKLRAFKAVQSVDLELARLERADTGRDENGFREKRRCDNRAAVGLDQETPVVLPLQRLNP